MDIEKLIERLKSAAGGPEGIQMCQDAATALSTLQAENEQLRHRLIEAISACSRIAEWAQDTGHDYVEGIARDFLDGEGNRP